MATQPLNNSTNIPKVSVIMNCLNCEKHLREAIDSVYAQTYPNWEIIFWDNSSIDSSAEIAKRYDDKLQYFRGDKTVPLGNARNLAVEKARGEYIAFLDCDDMWLPEKLEKQIKVLNSNNEVGLVYSDSYILRNGKKDKRTYFEDCSPHKGLVFEKLLLLSESSNFIPQLTVIIKRKTFEEIGYFKKEFKIGLDLELFLRVAEKYELDYIDEPLTIYRIHQDNFSQNKHIYVKEALVILEYWEKKRPDIFTQNKGILQKKRGNLLSELGNYYALRGDRKEAIVSFGKSINHFRRRNVIIKKLLVTFFGCTGYKLVNTILKSY